MDSEDDPYKLLEVSKEASQSQIKAAYRKAALKHHPDKQQTEEAKIKAHAIFSKISNAYECVSDEQKRVQYEQEQIKKQQQARTRHEFNFPSAHFHDPFQVFQQVFREEFGGLSATSMSPMFGRGNRRAVDPFFEKDIDNFFGNPLMSRQRRYDPFDRSMNMFGGRGFDDMFESMNRDIQQQQQQHSSQGRANNNQQQQNYSFYSSSSSTSYGGAGETVSTQVTRRIVNGQEETVTEKIVTKADGTVERQVLENNNNSGSSNSFLDNDQQASPSLQDHEDKKYTQHNDNETHSFLPWRRRLSSRKKTENNENTQQEQGQYHRHVESAESDPKRKRTS
eukprot:CAMPEP_0198153220 /NCGR_PEP_ID=MMETSP1443-20131203/63221_1 /TAXON_ID=186043 /ORGANISM="Entomoneis sp., Strain CCMP2396" /LENGTH=336 /DNA_ID=CAMNT_0043819477 /DNA_START=83 /DNA_END=1093 /DNA_ORIENTATION=-